MSATSGTSMAFKGNNVAGKRSSSFQLKPGVKLVNNAKPKQTTKTKGAAKLMPQKGRTFTESKKEKPKYNEEATEKFNQMLNGDLTDLPPLPKTMVKIFLSSTFSDMRAERNTLVREVYPYLREYCTSCGLDFQVVDMRWGVTEDSINDHSVEKLCLLEVANCQKTSVGPNFVVLSGDRYGFRPIPVELDVKTFEVLRHQASKLNLDNCTLLDEWYKLDKNAVPNMYILQPIRSKFTFFADFSPGCEEPRQKDTADWWKTFEALQEILRKSADAAYKEGLISAEERHQYFLSVTECEIQDGILKAQDVDKHCLVYNRVFKGLDGACLQLKDAPRFKDVTKTEKGNVINEEVADLRQSLFDDKIKPKLSSSNIKGYKIHFIPNGVNPEENEEHSIYIKQFCLDFITDCKNLIDKAGEENENLIQMSNYYTDYAETIHHLKFCQSKCESFCGQEKVLQAAKNYILDQSGRKPLIMHAESGVGKTSIMAMIMKSIPEWLDNKPHVKVIRFIGTTPQSLNIYDVLFGVLGQLSDAYNSIMPPVNYTNMKKLVEFTPRYLRRIATVAKEPVIVLLDSVDQLSPSNNAYSMDWLPTMLPKNLKVIISTLPEEHGILKNLKRLLPDQECYVEVPFLSEEAGKLIVETYMKLKKRTITPNQTKLLLSAFKESPSPLFLKLVLDEARQWNSYTPNSDLELAPTVKQAINKLFSNLENKFGQVLVSHALGYITVGLSGLTEFEIEDVLSCDDEVLNAVYKYHDPPVPGIVRIPPVLWARIRYDIRDYLVEKMSQGKSTLYWYHRQFMESAHQRYTNNGKEAELHKNLVNIYLPENGFKHTITLVHRKNLKIEEADRQITPQPFTSKNRRKLACLPYHALRAKKVLDKEIALKSIYCSFNFLCTKISGYSVASVVSDLTDFVEETEDAEVKLLLHFLSVRKDDMTITLRFAVCLLAYIKPADDHSHLKELQIEARAYIESKSKPVLVPDFPCLAPRLDASSAFQTSLNGFSDILATSNTSILLEKPDELDKDDKRKDKTEKSNYAVLSSDTQELSPIGFKEESLTQFIINSTYVFYVTNSALVRYDIAENKNDNYPLADLIPDWNNKDHVQNMFPNSDRTVAALTFKTSIVLIDLEGLKFVHKFSITQKPVMIENVVLMNTNTNSIAVGRIVNSSESDEPQGPDNQRFVSMFEQDKEEPVKFIEITQDLNCGQGTVVGKDQWFVVPVKTELSYDCEASADDGFQKPENGQLLVYNINDGNKAPKCIDIPHAVSKLSGHPEKTELVALTCNGTVYTVKFSEKTDESEALTIVLNFPVSDFVIDWEEDIAFLCSSGKVIVYKLMTDRNVGAFNAHSVAVLKIMLLDQQFVTLSANREMKVWSTATIVKDLQQKDIGMDLEMAETLLEQMNITALHPSSDGNELITCHDSGFVKIWSIESKTFLRKYNIEMSANLVRILIDNIVVFHDVEQGKMQILDIDTGLEAIALPDTIQNIMHSVVNKKKDTLYLISAAKKGKEQIDVININLKKVSKTIRLQSGLIYESVELFLSANEKYIVLRHKIPESEFERVKAMWKTGGFGEQNHHYRFTATDLSQRNGALIPCFRQQSKIPTLGVFVQPYKGNVMLISSRRWIIFWDIPTGKCDQKPSKVSKDGMFYRPAWLGQDCSGANSIFMQSGHQKYLACGSEDGYVFIYNSESGIPVSRSKPSTRHNAEVQRLAISPDDKWVASSCRSSVLKLWDSCYGGEQFSVRLDAEVQSMYFTKDSAKLVLYTGTSTTRVLIFHVFTGK
ncbi:uncharacterized protein LOC123563752 [Mercenaria mercenaria]|uniref:uncharacterized protein LOC123563752 n=1 Tax=Mercenaria mercenaria TaxID=6596 RepID=UPI00234E905A|nr:uncharacterized protein LOC123563752 [Mercenaria mercenaria]